MTILVDRCRSCCSYCCCLFLLLLDLLACSKSHTLPHTHTHTHQEKPYSTATVYSPQYRRFDSIHLGIISVRLFSIYCTFSGNGNLCVCVCVHGIFLIHIHLSTVFYSTLVSNQVVRSTEILNAYTTTSTSLCTYVLYGQYRHHLHQTPTPTHAYTHIP